MKALALLIVLAAAACGPADDVGVVTAHAGEPCPGYGHVACDGPCTVLCFGDDAGVWVVDRCTPRCGGGGISVSVSKDGAP